MTDVVTAGRAKRDPGGLDARRRAAAIADARAREFLRQADPILAQLIGARPNFRPRAWMAELPPLDAFGTLIFQVAGQQLSVGATRTILSRLQERFGDVCRHRPSCSQRIPKCFGPAASRLARARHCGRWRNGSSTDA
jgi:3-methyladenine DNA glycosylase/8-oxoguanine DNA glycosylase